MTTAHLLNKLEALHADSEAMFPAGSPVLACFSQLKTAIYSEQSRQLLLAGQKRRDDDFAALNGTFLPQGCSDAEEYERAHAGGRIADARALNRMQGK
jgi:hypothetical protein